jgi:phospholipid transport system transporter-binding protein
MRPYRVRDSHALMISELDTGYFDIKGDLTFATINQNALTAIKCARAGQLVQIDLQNVSSTDSAGLALMIEWLKISKQHNCTLKFINIPLQLQALAKISGIDQSLYLTLQADDKSTLNNTPWIN